MRNQLRPNGQGRLQQSGMYTTSNDEVPSEEEDGKLWLSPYFIESLLLKIDY